MPCNNAPANYSHHPERIHGEPDSPAERKRREAYLDQLLDLVKPQADNPLSDPRISPVDESWSDWLNRTGELPPDFDRLPAIADLPDPLRREEDGTTTEITDESVWQRQRGRLKDQLQYWLYGEIPPAPEGITATTIDTYPADGGTVREIRLRFGPDGVGLTLQVMTPDGSSPFPVFVTQWNHRKWALLALQRGYMAVIYAGADALDDTADYRKHYSKYDFQLLARRAWGAHRVVDYLETRSDADTDRIGLTGASRNGKQALIAAAFDERIDAVVPCSAGSGGVVPARFDRDDMYAGDMSLHARLRRSWFHPRWRFFVGRENQLPVDANSLVSLVAPRACMLHTALNERTTSSWAVGRVYESVQSVYDLLDAGENFVFRCRQGRHARTTRDIQHIIDFFDYAFDRRNIESPAQRYHQFSFTEWAETAGSDFDIEMFPRRGIDPLLRTDDGAKIRTEEAWEKRKSEIRDRIRWTLGDRPPRASLPSQTDCEMGRRHPDRSDYTNDIIGRPELPDNATLRLSPSSTYGERFESDLYHPTADAGNRSNKQFPVIIWLHPYSYNTGYGAGDRGQVPVADAINRGFALHTFDQIGFGTRVIEGDRFYERHPDWSKMGKMVEDTLAAVETLSTLDCVDSERIFLLGYSMGATVGLYAAAFDERIAGIASVCGVSSLRVSNNETERRHAPISRLSHMHGLQPRLGLFREDPARIPFDFHEVLGLVAPRPLLTVAPSLDWTHPQDGALQCVEEARTVYGLFDAEDNLDCWTPEDLLSFDYHEARLYDGKQPDHAPLTPTRRADVFNWLVTQCRQL